MSQMLEPAGLDEGHLSSALGSLYRKDIDAADLYFQVSRSESWTVEDGILKEAVSASTRGSAFAPSRARRPASPIPKTWCLPR